MIQLRAGLPFRPLLACWLVVERRSSHASTVKRCLNDPPGLHFPLVCSRK